MESFQTETSHEIIIHTFALFDRALFDSASAILGYKLQNTFVRHYFVHLVSPIHAMISVYIKIREKKSEKSKCDFVQVNKTLSG